MSQKFQISLEIEKKDIENFKIDGIFIMITTRGNFTQRILE